ncbi:MAG: DNA polymerase I [Bacteroidota bacterium]
MNNSVKKIFLIDAMALIYRGYFALIRSPRINEKGLNTGAILGFANSLVEVLQNQKPTHVVVAFDTPAPTFRQEMYKDYKVHRQDQPEDITLSIPYVKKFLEALHIPFIEQDGYEADDVLGTLSRQASLEDFQVYLMTPDKDFAQLVNANTYLYKPGIGKGRALIWQEAEVLKDWGIDRPDQVKDILALWGDASDNIPGVPNVGKKTAQKLIKQFGAIENLLKHTDSLKGTLQKNVKEYGPQALLSKKLATICTTVPLKFDLHKGEYKAPNAQKVIDICHELGFRQLPKRILGQQAHNGTGLQKSLFDQSEVPNQAIDSELAFPKFTTLKDSPYEYLCVDSLEACQELVLALKKQQHFAFDTETTGLDHFHARLIGISISYQPHQAYYINLNHPQANQLLEVLKPIFLDEKKEKIGQNLKYDLHILQQHEIEVKPPFFDTMVAHHLLHPTSRHNLDDMAKSYLGYQPIGIEDLIGKKEKGVVQKCMSEVALDKLVNYACEDADVTFRLFEKMKKELVKEELMGLFAQVEMPLLPVLVAMEKRGVSIDSKALKEISTVLGHEMDKLVEATYTLAGVVFNLDSPKQLGNVLFDELKIIEKPEKTKSGQYNTNQATLSKLVNKHPIIAKVMEYRELKKLKSTYVDALPELVNPSDNRLHTSYHQTHVYTGRLSSSNPNLQNIPIRTERGRLIRKAFISPNPAYTLLSADYSQIELRLMAHFSKDEAMKEAFKEGKDIHAATAAKIFKTDVEQVTASMRRKAKMVNFGIIYGMSVFGLAQRLEIPRQEAKTIIDAYFKEFPSIKTYMENTVAQAREQGFMTTLAKRKRFFPNINSRNATLRNMEERAAINMPIQGSAAELIKHAMIAIHNWIAQEKLPAYMIMQVHDELVFEVANTVLTPFKKHVKTLMQNTVPLSVPLVVDVGIGENWLKAH